VKYYNPLLGSALSSCTSLYANCKSLAATLSHRQSQTDGMLIDNKLAGQYFSETTSMRHSIRSGIDAQQLATDLANVRFPH
jgi:hypothetical protein